MELIKYEGNTTLSLKEQLDKVDEIVKRSAYDGFYYSRLNIKVGMWEKGKIVAEYRGVKSASFYQLEKETSRQRESLKQWHDLYEQYPDRDVYIGIAEEKARAWANRVFIDNPKKDTIAIKWTGNEENYTPEKYIEKARQVMGSIDTDPASNELAQKTVKANQYYTKENNGLDKPWEENIFLNPPYSHGVIDQFINKLLRELDENKQAILLTNNNTDTQWFHKAAERCNALCFTEGRINFYIADLSTTSPTNGQAFFYFGQNVNRFRDIFRDVGLIMRVF